jgi:hypothetical protein
MPMMSSNATCCPDCNATAIRDEKLLDTLQTAMVALTAVDGINDPVLRVARAKSAVIEAQRLIRKALDVMQVRQW